MGSRCWNAGQVMAAAVATVAALALFAYPPWLVRKEHAANVNTGGIWHFAGHSHTASEFLGHAPLLAPPADNPWERPDDRPVLPFGSYRFVALGYTAFYQVNFLVLCAEVLAVVLAGLLAVRCLRSRPPAPAAASTPSD